MHPNLPLLSSILAAAASLAAQTAVSLPDHAGAADGHEAAVEPFGVPHFRTQLLLDAAAIAPNGAQISGLRFRADRAYVPSTATSVPNVTVSISQTSAALSTMSLVFANNISQTPTVVFQGTVNLPAHTTAGPGPLPWDIVVPFNVPWQMTTSAGNVLVEIIGNNPLGSLPNYFLDSVVAGGMAGEFGQAGNYPNDDLRLSVSWGGVLGWDPRGLSPGNTIRFYSGLNATNPPGVLALGLALQPVPIDLGPLGAPTHTLYVDPIFFVPHSWIQTVFFGWYSLYPLAVPNNPALVGTMIYGQSAVFDATANALGLALSAAVEVRIGDAVAEPPLQQMSAADPAATMGWPARGVMPPEHGGTPVLLEGVFF